MIGFLCDDRHKKRCVEWMHSLCRYKKEQNEIPMIVFTMSDIIFDDRKVSGCMASPGDLEPVVARLPSIILNLIPQPDLDDLEKLIKLATMEGITLINGVNRFDQSMAMEILSSSAPAKKYVLPYSVYNVRDEGSIPDRAKDYLVIPSMDASLFEVLYVKTLPQSHEGQYSHHSDLNHILKYIDFSSDHRYWIFIEMPDMLAHSGKPVVIRTYVQKGFNGAWSVTGKNTFPQMKLKNAEYQRKTDEAALTIINRLNKSMPFMGICFIDFIIDSKGSPYFLHLGGFDCQLFYQSQADSFYENFYKNLASLYYHYTERALKSKNS